jgi:NAD(P)-dependent dehydrogenase (short-subunit alcohol dehydrogenase family)
MIETPVVVITGCGGGIGLATAVAFAERGYMVVASVRDPSRVEHLTSGLSPYAATSEIVGMDVTDDEAVTNRIAQVVARHGRIDVVVSNAGLGYDGNVEELSVDDFRHTMEVNFFGAVRLLKAVMPTMRAAGSGRIIGVSSIAGNVGQPFNDSYCASKFALEGLFESFHPNAAAHGVHLSLIEPGPVATDFVGKSRGPADANDDQTYAAEREGWRAIQDGGFRNPQSAEEIAQQILDIATSDAPHLRYQTSEGIMKLTALKLKDLTGDRITSLTRNWITQRPRLSDLIDEVANNEASSPEPLQTRRVSDE